MNMTKESISKAVWEMKYRYRLQDEIIDQTIEDTWRRVAAAVALAEIEADRAKWEALFYQILQDFKYLPGGRILAGAGTAHQVTLFNCFVMQIAEDSIPAIFSALKEGAITLQQGGGIGYDFSLLRPKGSPAKQSGTTSSGPVSFMQIWDTTCGVLLSTGARRGAMMAVLRCDHPDIEAFIHAKEDKAMLRHFNVSVYVTDDFMQAVKQDADWPLIFPSNGDESTNDEIIYREWCGKKEVPCRVYKRIRARELWQKIIRAAYDYAEPGVLFADTINRLNNLWYREYIGATNPCGEIPLPQYGACNLGAINLAAFVRNPYSPHATLDWQALKETVRIATRFQDDVIDVSHYPLQVQEKEVKTTRRIGLGVTGLADMFVMLNILYGSDESLKLTDKIMQCVADETWDTSIELAKEKGSFQDFNEHYLQGEFVKQLDKTLQEKIATYGMRNSHHNTIAPTGTISLLANNISNGIEPIFQAEYERNVRDVNNELITFKVIDYAYALWKQMGNKGLPPAWIDTENLEPKSHLAVQAIVQRYVDNAISKTINIPVDFPFEKVIDVYTHAYELGLKGCTIFRPNKITGSVLLNTKCESSAEGDCCPEE